VVNKVNVSSVSSGCFGTYWLLNVMRSNVVLCLIMLLTTDDGVCWFIDYNFIVHLLSKSVIDYSDGG